MLQNPRLRLRTATSGKGAGGPRLGALLRQWRMTRRMSQLDLALEAEISSRHLSFVESGKAQPSREMMTRLCDALKVPLRDRNALFIAAGYAPVYRESNLTAPEMALAFRAIEFILRQQEPYPAIVLNRVWDIVLANDGAAKLVHFLLGKQPDERNVVRQIFRNDLLRPFIINWEEVASDMLRRVEQEIHWDPLNQALPALRDEVLSYPGVPEQWRLGQFHAPLSPLMNFIFHKDDVELRFFYTWTTFGTPHDITLEELKIDSSFPADEETERQWRKLGN
jgi:transcriptional regulator with XRE-family HTH domain